MGTTVGCINGMDSFTCIYSEYNIKQTSVKVAILPYNRKSSVFSASRDSGVIIGMLTVGGSVTEVTNTTYLTLYWWLDEQIKKVFPSCYLYDVVQ